MLLHFLDTYQGLLQEEEGAGHIIKVGLGKKRWVSKLLTLEGGPFEGAILLKLGTRRQKMSVGLELYGSSMLEGMGVPTPALAESGPWDKPLPSPSLFSSPQDLYLLIMKDESLYQDLREDTLRLHQLVETVELK